MPHWSRLLASTFGGLDSLDGLTVAHIEALVTNGVVEHEELDFKGADYANNEQVDLACDVASLSNQSGGLILIGVTQDDAGVANGTPGVDTGEGRLRRLDQIIGARVTPYPAPAVVAITEPGEQRGFIVIAVERSSNPPVAALADVGPRFTLRYPVRAGTTTRFLNEPEIARAYRDREQSRSDRRDRLNALWIEALRALSTEHAWLLAVFVPDVPGQVTFSREFLEGLQHDWPRAFPLTASHVHTYRHAMISQGRIAADGNPTEDKAVSDYVRYELLDDGSSVFGWRIGWPDREEPTAYRLAEEQICATTLGALQILGQLTRTRAGVTGRGTVRCGIVAADKATHVLQLAAIYTFPSDGKISRPPYHPTDLSVDVDDLITVNTKLIQTAAHIANNIMQGLGVIEQRQLTREGKVNLASNLWPSGTGPMTAWAASNGLDVVS